MSTIRKQDTIKVINEIMRDFTNITKVAAIYVNNRGTVLSQEYNFSPFCKEVRKNSTYKKRCNQCDLYGGLEATKNLQSCPYRCHICLIDFSVPVMQDGAILGFIMAGQAKTEDTTIQPILSSQTDWKNNTKLKELYDSLPILTAEQLYSATKVLRVLVGHQFPIIEEEASVSPKSLPIETNTPSTGEQVTNLITRINHPEIRKAILYME